MPLDRDDPGARRSVVPPVAGRSLWLAAAWTGAGAALVCCVTAIAVVAVCWLPASAGTGSAASAIRAGVLTFLSALHGGVTVDGLPADFVPLGMTLAVAAVAWRAGAGLADAADLLEARRPGRLVQAGLLQALVFAACCGAAAHLAVLGTSRVSALAAVLSGFLLFAVAAGTAFVRSSPLGDELRPWLPGWARAGARGAAAALAVYLAAGAVLVAGSIVVHHQRVEYLSRQLGGGWSGVPVLLLGVLAAPNAVIAAAGYLAGPGFAVGGASTASLGAGVHGTLPAFPLLGAVPSGPAGTPAWLLAAATPLLAGWCAVRAAGGAHGWWLRLRDLGAAALFTAFAGLVLAWQGGGAIGSGRLAAVGASPWRFGLAVAAAVAAVGAVALAALRALAWWRERGDDVGDGSTRPLLAAVPSGGRERAGDDGEADVLAG